MEALNERNDGVEIEQDVTEATENGTEISRNDRSVTPGYART